MKPMVIDGNVVTVPISDDAQRAIAEVMRRHTDDLDAALQPFGLTARDVLIPTFERFVLDPESDVSEQTSDRIDPGRS